MSKVLKSINIMGFPFISATTNELDEFLAKRLASKTRTVLVTANPEIVMFARENDHFRETVEQADAVTPDGVGIIIAGKILGTPLEERLTGFDLVQRLFTRAETEGWSFYFLGTKREILDEAIAEVETRWPRAKIVGSHDGYFKEDAPILADIKAANPDIILVGLGSPKQEEWIAKYKNEFPPGLYMGVGGTFDGLAGKMKRAPESWQKLNIEWLYRLIQEPSRWRRMLALPHFLIRVYQKKYFSK